MIEAKWNALILQVRAAKVSRRGVARIRIIFCLQNISNILIILASNLSSHATMLKGDYMSVPKLKKKVKKKVKTIASVCWLCSNIPFVQDCVQKIQKMKKKTISSVMLGHQVHMLAEYETQCKWWFNKCLGSVGCVQTSNFDKIGLKKDRKNESKISSVMVGHPRYYILP